MINLPIKKLFRRCLLIAVIGVATGCASVKQMPSSPVVIQERSFNVVKEVDVPAVTIPPLVSPTLEVLEQDLVLENPATDSVLTKYISSRFKVSEKIAGQILYLADKYAHDTFPKRNDILAIIAVESHYNIKAFFHGCFGLMQIERRSHAKTLKGRSLYNPEVNIEIGSNLLNEYFGLIGNAKGTVLAFNAGIGNYNRNRYKLEYYIKYKKELELISKL